jgi:hypothetical protein
VQRLLDVDHDGLVAPHDEAERAGKARPVEQRQHRHGFGGRPGRLEIDMGEAREILGGAEHRRVDGDAAGGEPVLIELADGAEIGCAEEGDPVVPAPIERAVAGLLEAEAGKAGIVRDAMGGRIRRHLEIGAVVDDLARLPALDNVHADRRSEIAAHMEEGDGEFARPVRPQREVGPELDLAVGVVVDLLQDFRGRARRRLVGRTGHRLRALLQRLEGRRRGRPEAQALERVRGERRAGSSERAQGAGEKGAAVHHLL